MAPMPFDALEAFLQEHPRCEFLDGGVDDGFVWFQLKALRTVTVPVSFEIG